MAIMARRLVDINSLGLPTAVHMAGGKVLHPADNCPKNDKCTIWEEFHRHPILGRLVS